MSSPTLSKSLVRVNWRLRVPHAPLSIPPRTPVRSYATAFDPPLKKTGLHDLHVRNGAKMVPFAGYSMPLQYPDLGIGDSHRWTREKASIFDVGHMVQHRIGGPGATGLLKRVTPASVGALGNHKSQLTCFLHQFHGGIVDDAMLTRLGPEMFYLVTNAACRDKDIKYLGREKDAWLQDNPEATVDWELMDGWGLVAVQGPLSAEILDRVLDKSEVLDLKQLHFGDSRYTHFQLANGEKSGRIMVSRSGYTGEDGFEVSVPPGGVEAITEALLHSGTPDRIRLAGLAARDSLRLEAGMCLYGHDLDDSTTPVEADLAFIIKKDRRIEGGFHGDQVIMKQLAFKNKEKKLRNTDRKRVGLIVEGPPAREGAEIFDSRGGRIGKVTSGCPSPTLGKNIAMGYIENRESSPVTGDEVSVKVRGVARKAVITKMPFVAVKYWKGTAPA